MASRLRRAPWQRADVISNVTSNVISQDDVIRIDDVTLDMNFRDYFIEFKMITSAQMIFRLQYFQLEIHFPFT